MCMPEGEVRSYFVLPIRMKWMLILNWHIWDIRWFVHILDRNCKLWNRNGNSRGCFKLRTDCGSGTQYVLVFPCNEDPFGPENKRNARKNSGDSSVSLVRGPALHVTNVPSVVEPSDNPELQFRYCSKCVGNVNTVRIICLPTSM